MFQKTLTVKYIITSKTCFAYLSEKCYRLLEQGVSHLDVYISSNLYLARKFETIALFLESGRSITWGSQVSILLFATNKFV